MISATRQLTIFIIVIVLMAAFPDCEVMAGMSGDPVEASGLRSGTQVMASVNGVSITAGELYEHLMLQYGRKALGNLIDAGLVSQRAKVLGIAVSDADLEAKIVRTARQFGGEEKFAAALKQHGQTREQFKHDLVFDETLRRILIRDIPVDDPTLQRFFEANRATFEHREIHHRHILGRTEEEAKDIKTQLDGGADFSSLANARSNDANSFQKGGDMGWWPLDRTPDAYQNVVSGLKVGEISAPFRSYLGWDVAQVLEIKGSVEFDAAKEQVKEAYLRNVVQQRRDPWLAEQRHKANIEQRLFDPEGNAHLEIQVVALVNGEAITRDELYEVMKVHYGAGALAGMIDAKLVSQYAATAGITVSDAEILAYVGSIKKRLGDKGPAETDGATLAQLKAEKATEVLVRKILSQDVKVDDTTMRQFFETHRDQFDWRVVHSRHILRKTEAEAKAVKAQVDAGADFAALAKERSIDANTYANGGDLGWTGRGQTPPEYEYAIFKLKQDEISAPVRSFLGWHIGQVLEIKGAPDFETMKAAIREAYLEDQIKEKYRPWFAEQQRKAAITNTLQSATGAGER
jgi:foldase protein PrsA